MYQSRRTIIRNSKGFTLIEALFQVAVFILFSHLLILIYLWIHQMNNTILTNEHIAWELFVKDVQKYFTNVEEISVSKKLNELNIKQVDITDHRQFDRYGDIIRLRINNKGYIPLLIGIRNAQFELNGNLLTIKAEFQNGLTKERTFFVELSKE